MYFKRESVDNVWWASSVCIRVCMFRAWKDGPTDERTDGWMNGCILLCSYATFARNEILFFSFTDYGIYLWLKITPNVSSYRDMFENSSDFNVLKSDITLWVSPWFSRDWTGLTLSLPLSVSISSFSCSITRNVTSHIMKNLAFHSLLRWKLIILPILTASITWENWLFEPGSNRVMKQ